MFCVHVGFFSAIKRTRGREGPTSLALHKESGWTMVKNCMNLDQRYKHIQSVPYKAQERIAIAEAVAKEAEAVAKGKTKGKATDKGKGQGQGQDECQAKGQTKNKGEGTTKVCQNREHWETWGSCKGRGRFCHLIFVGSMLGRVKSFWQKDVRTKEEASIASDSD
jgi:hypothetical protein